MKTNSKNTYGWYVAVILLIGFTFSFIDRQVLNLLVVPIQADLGITDVQISALQGLAFVLTYVGICIPIGRLVDRYNRVNIMTGGVLLWSVATVACGLSRSYIEMFVSRLGVGAGESTIHPGAVSVLGDYFEPDKLARPLSVYLLGPYLGAGIAMIFGAQVLEWTSRMDDLTFPLIGYLAPWQLTFIAVGLPGIIVAALFLTIREPVRVGRLAESKSILSWPQIIDYISKNRQIYVAIILGNSCLIILLYGLQSWIPTTLRRVYEWDLIQAGRVYGLIALVAGSAGVLSGPFAVRFLESKDYSAAPLQLAMAGMFVATVFLALLPWQSNVNTALICITLASFFVTFPLAGTTSLIVLVSPNEMRGVVTGLYVVVTSILGLVLGPTLVAASTDYVFQDPIAVAKSLAFVALVIGPIGIVLIWNGTKHFAPIRPAIGGSTAG